MWRGEGRGGEGEGFPSFKVIDTKTRYNSIGEEREYM